MLETLGPNAWAYGVLTVVLVTAAITDVRSGKIRNWLTYPALAVALVGHTLRGGLWGQSMENGTITMGLFASLAGFAVGFFPLMLAWLAGGIGGGDAKLMGVVGALVGWPFALTALMYGLIVALIMALIIMIAKRITADTLKRTGQFLWLLLAKARPGGPSTAESPTVPFGLALCIGSAAALLLAILIGPERSLFILGL